MKQMCVCDWDLRDDSVDDFNVKILRPHDSCGGGFGIADPA